MPHRQPYAVEPSSGGRAGGRTGRMMRGVHVHSTEIYFCFDVILRATVPRASEQASAANLEREVCGGGARLALFAVGVWADADLRRRRGEAKSEVDVSSLVDPLVVSDGVEEEEEDEDDVSWDRGGRAGGWTGDGGGSRSKGIALVARVAWRRSDKDEVGLSCVVIGDIHTGDGRGLHRILDELPRLTPRPVARSAPTARRLFMPPPH